MDNLAAKAAEGSTNAEKTKKRAEKVKHDSKIAIKNTEEVRM